MVVQMKIANPKSLIKNNFDTPFKTTDGEIALVVEEKEVCRMKRKGTWIYTGYEMFETNDGVGGIVYGYPQNTLDTNEKK